MQDGIHNVNVVSQGLLPTPGELKLEIPLSDSGRETVLSGRRAVANILW